MNTLMLVALAVVAFCYCGGKYCPSVLKQNKEVVLGVLVGMALSSFAGLKLEGIDGGGITKIGDVNLNQTVRTHLMDSLDYPGCLSTMSRLFSEGAIDVTQYTHGSQACTMQYSDARATRARDSGGE
jgi:hypothetical protein